MPCVLECFIGTTKWAKFFKFSSIQS